MTAEQITAYVAEFVRRFEARTPATQIDEILPPTRVGRGEMQLWYEETYGVKMTLDDRLELDAPLRAAFRQLRRKYPLERWK